MTHPNWRNHYLNPNQIQTAKLISPGEANQIRKKCISTSYHDFLILFGQIILILILFFSFCVLSLYRIKPLQGIQIPGSQTSRFNQKKYNIWSKSLQEEVMENLKGCEVDQDSSKYDRNIESYDYSLKYRINGENSLKRRQSYSDDSDKGYNGSSSNFFEAKNKRFRANSLNVKDRRNVRLRLGNRSDDSSSNDGSTMKTARCILDLNVTADYSDEQVARDIANKLYEEKDDLMSK